MLRKEFGCGILRPKIAGTARYDDYEIGHRAMARMFDLTETVELIEGRFDKGRPV